MGIKIEYRDGSSCALLVSSVPYRKSRALCALKAGDDGAVMYPLAYFRNDRYADECESFLNRLAGVEVDDAD